MTWRTWVLRHRDELFAAVLVVAMTTELAIWTGEGPVRLFAVGWIATLPVALRRRSPLVCFLLVMLGLFFVGVLQPGFDNSSMSFVVTYLVALYSLGRYAVGVEAWLGGIGLLAPMALFAATDDAGLSGADLGDVAFILGFVGAPWAAGLAIRLRGDLARAHERLKIQQEEQTRRAIAEERATIARELHDVVAHAISVTVLQARGARRMLGRDEGQVRRSLDAIEHTNTQALGDMRRLLALLRDTEGDSDHSPQPSLARLDELVADVERSGLPVAVETDGDARGVPPGVDLSAYRIVQEALTNVLKHAGPATATVSLFFGSDDLTLAVTDTGSGGRVNGTGHGLVGIRERVAVAGGEVEAGPGPDGGFTVRARLPYSVEA